MATARFPLHPLILQVFLGGLLATLGCTQKNSSPARPLVLHAATLPSFASSDAPRLQRARDGSIALTLVEHSGDGARLHLLKAGPTTWTSARVMPLAEGWIDHPNEVPELLEFAPQRAIALWSGRATGSYDLLSSTLIADSDGARWTPPAVVHNDATDTEHGLSTLIALDENQALAIWLDGRGYAASDTKTKHAALRSARVDSMGRVSARQVIDPKVCDCCPVVATMTQRGPIVVYRDRNDDEVRDLSFAHFSSEQWSSPQPIARDGWQINGCPMNGPSVSHHAGHTAVAWYSAAGERPRVWLSRSQGAAMEFAKKIRIDDGHPLGHPALAQIDASTTAVIWLERSEARSELRLRTLRTLRTEKEPSTRNSTRVTLDPNADVEGMPQVLADGGRLIFAWTRAGSPSRVQLAYADVGAI